MPDPRAVRQVCVLLRDGRVLTDDDGRLPSYVDDQPWIDLDRRALTCGDPSAVLVAPQLPVSPDGHLLISVFASRTDTAVDGTGRQSTQIAEIDSAASATLRVIAEVVAGCAAAAGQQPGVVPGVLVRRGRRVDRRRPRRARPVSHRADGAGEGLEHLRGAPGAVRADAGLDEGLVPPLPRRAGADPSWWSRCCRAYAPPSIAVDEERGWLLLEDMAGADEEHEDAPPAGLRGRRRADRGHRPTALARPSRRDRGRRRAGARADRDDARLRRGPVDGSRARPAQSATSSPPLAPCRDEVHAAVDELAALRSADTLVHGDLHPGNVAHEGDAVVLYDWSDAAVSHPFLDLVLLSPRACRTREAELAKAAFVEAWRAAYPVVDFDRASGWPRTWRWPSRWSPTSRSTAPRRTRRSGR